MVSGGHVRGRGREKRLLRLLRLLRLRLLLLQAGQRRLELHRLCTRRLRRSLRRTHVPALGFGLGFVLGLVS